MRTVAEMTADRAQKAKQRKAWINLVNDPGCLFIGGMESFMDIIAPKEPEHDTTDT